jgi:hypothetical protein
MSDDTYIIICVCVCTVLKKQFIFETHVFVFDLKGEHAEFPYTGRMMLRVVTSVLCLSRSSLCSFEYLIF